MRNNPSKTKKAVSVLALACILIACFVSPVYAETFPVAWRHISQTKNNGSVQVVVYASQYGPFDGSVDVSASETAIQDEIIYVNVFVKNNSDDNVLINGLGYKLFLEDPTGLYADFVKIAIDYELVRGDFNMVQSGNDGWYWINGNSEFAYEYKPVIPSHTALSATFKLKLPTFTDPGTEAHQVTVRQKAMVSRIQISDYTATVTDYVPLGSHQDITEVLDEISTYISSNSGIPLLHSDLVELANILKANQITNQNITSDSSTLKIQSDAVHSQEASFYASNTQAIEATGLSNYQFSTTQSNGIGAVRNDFVAIWNAMDGWTSVYIFSLTLGLALTIIRHAPSAISRRRRRSQE